MTGKDLRDAVPGLVNAGCPLPDVLGGGQPTPAHLASLAEAGVRTVLDLRAPDEPRGYDEAARAREAGLDYVSLPITGATLGDATFDRMRALMSDPGRRPIFVHCGSGNRVGALLLPYLVLDEGKDPDEAIELAVGVGLQSQQLADLAFDYIGRVARGDDREGES